MKLLKQHSDVNAKLEKKQNEDVLKPVAVNKTNTGLSRSKTDVSKKDINRSKSNSNVSDQSGSWFLNREQTKLTQTYKVIESTLPVDVKSGEHHRSVQDRLKRALQKTDAVKETQKPAQPTEIAKKSCSGKMIFDIASGKLRQMDRIDQALSNGDDLYSLNVHLLSEEETKKLAIIYFELDRQKEIESFEAQMETSQMN